MDAKPPEDGSENLIGAASVAVWLLIAGLLPAVFMPGAMSPFAPVKRDVFYLLALVQFGLVILKQWGNPYLLAGRAAVSPAALPAALAALVTIFCLALRRETGTGVSALLDTAFGAGLCVVYLSEGTRRTDLKMLAVFTLSCLAAAAYGAAQYLGMDPLTWKTSFAGDAPGSTFGNPLFLADGLLGALACLLVFIAFGGGWRRAAFAAGILAWCVLLATQARGAWLGLALGVAPALAWIASRYGPRGAVKRLAVFGICALLLAAGFSRGWRGRSVPVVSRAASVLSPFGGAFLGRFLLWESTALMIREKPVAGWGAGNLKLHYQEFQGRLLASPRYSGLEYHTTSHSHNDFLQIFAERGVVGLGLFFWLLACFLAFVIRGRTVRPAQAAATLILLGWLVNSLFNGPLSLPPSSLLFWIFIAVACRRDRAAREAARPGTIPASGTPAALALYVFVLFTARPFARDLVSESYLQSGEFARERGDTRNALIMNLKSLDLALEDRRHHFYLGQVYFARGMVKEAAEEFALDVSANPSVATGFYNLGVARMALGGYEDALAAFKAAEAIDPNNSETKRMIREARERAEGKNSRASGAEAVVN